MANKKQKKLTDEQIIGLIAIALAAGAPVNATASTLSPAMSIVPETIAAILVIAMSKPLTPGSPPTITPPTALSEAERLEVHFRSTYVLAASRRVRRKLAAGTPRRVALAQEREFFNQHLAAAKNRQHRAAQVDSASRKYGPILGWHATLDLRTSPECMAANGRNFEASKMPPIGYPGAVHPSCRCRAGRKFATTQTVYTVKPKNRRAA